MSLPLYIGHPSCPEAFRIVPGRIPDGGTVCVSVPPVTPAREDVFVMLLRLLRDRPETELALNDWGTLYRCAEMKRRGELTASLTAGVLLAGQDTDPLLAAFLRPRPDKTVYDADGQPVRLRWAPPPDTLVKHWRTPSVFACVPMLKELGVSRLELCAQPLPFPEEAPGLPVTLYRRAIVSVFPCGGDCGRCAGGPVRRGGAPLLREKNLLLADFPADLPPWIDRVTDNFVI